MLVSNSSGFIWIFLTALTNVLNDSIAKFFLSHQKMGVINLLFVRFAISSLRSLPSLIRRPQVCKSSYFGLHALRGVLFTLAMVGWSYSIVDLSLNFLTLISLTIPVLVLLLTPFFLGENRHLTYIVLTLGGMMGVALNFIHTCRTDIAYWPMILALSAMLLFVALDILNKYLLQRQESTDTMMVTSSLWSCVLLCPFAIYFWQTPTVEQFLLLVIISLAGDLFFYAWLKALQKYPMSFVQPLRNIEFLFSCVFSFVVSRRLPTISETVCCVFVVLTTLLISSGKDSVQKGSGFIG